MTPPMQSATPQQSGSRWLLVGACAVLYLPLLLLVLATSTLIEPESWRASVERILARAPREVPPLPVLRPSSPPRIALARDPFDPSPAVAAAPVAPAAGDADAPRLVATFRKGGSDFALVRVAAGLRAFAVGDAWSGGRIGVIGSNGIGVDAEGHRAFVPIQAPSAVAE